MDLALPASIGGLFSPEVRERLVRLRRSIHQHPELAFHENETAKRLTDTLAALGIRDISSVGGTGVVARIPGKDRSAPVVAIRGDIDALPIHEATGLAFASMIPGVMHACGHDVHATWAVGAAAVLVGRPPTGDVLVVLQPAEETGHGALTIIDSGALDGVVAIFGGHVDRRFPVGQVVADDGPLAASADTFEVEIVGAGAHAARPHESRDPIVCAAAVISALQTIVSRRLNPATAGVVTVGTIHAGSAPNIIPERATLTGTIRAVDAVSRRIMLDEVKRVCVLVAQAFDMAANVTLEIGTPPIVNPPSVTAWARQAATNIVSAENVVPLGFLNMAAEDFAHYMERIPGSFLRIGARESGGAIIPAHSPSFYAAEESVFVGAAVLAECAYVASIASAASA